MVQDTLETPDISFDYEPGSTFVLYTDSFTLVGDDMFFPFITFGSFQSNKEARTWLKQTGFVPHPEWETDPQYNGIHLYTAEDGREPLIINGIIFLKLGVRVVLNPPLPVTFGSQA